MIKTKTTTQNIFSYTVHVYWLSTTTNIINVTDSTHNNFRDVEKINIISF